MVPFFQLSDVLFVPLVFIFLYAIIRGKANNQKDPHLRKLYYTAFTYKIIFVFIFSFVVVYYFKGGDSLLYLHATYDLKTAITTEFNLIGDYFTSTKVTEDNPLFPYFMYDGWEGDITANYMESASNFSVPKLALLPSLLTNNSFICINLFFGFFALGGAIRLYKTFYYFYPSFRRELALAIIFLPDVCYWSSGLLKDPICFGAIGYILYGLLNIFIKKQKVGISILLILLNAIIVYYIKVYILLVLALSVVIWQFAEFNKVIGDKTLRRIFAVMSFAIAGGVGLLMVNYLTSQEAAQQYRLDTILQQTQSQREIYGSLSEIQTSGSYFQIDASNPFTLVFGGISATFFRPFPWEIKSPIMFFSALEAFLYLFLTLNFMIRRGIGSFFSITFKDPRTLMCFVFSMVFAVAIGTSTVNFGALSRYKIPCMPFYLIMVLLLYRNAKLRYPSWFSKILGYIKF